MQEAPSQACVLARPSDRSALAMPPLGARPRHIRFLGSAPPPVIFAVADGLVHHADTIAEFLECVPHARHVTVPRATHMVAGDANDAFVRHVLDFLLAVAPAATGTP